MARRGRRRRHRPGEQGHAAVPGGRPRRRARGGSALGRGAVTLGLGGHRHRVALWVPNLAWQAANGWPQVTMSASSGGTQTTIAPRSCRRCGSPRGLAAVPSEPSPAGPGCSSRRRQRRSGRSASPPVVMLALVVISGGKAYYVIGAVAPFIAAGAILLDRWLDRGHRADAATVFSRGGGLSGAAHRRISRCRSSRCDLRDDIAADRRTRSSPNRWAGRSSSRRWSGWSPPCRPTSVPAR